MVNLASHDLEQRISSDLADDLGNLLNRMVTLALKYAIDELMPPQKWSKPAQELYQESLAMMKEYQLHMDEFMFHMALGRLWKFINQTNAYFHAQEPWKIAQKDQAHFKEVLSATAHALQTIAVLLWPVMPKKMEQLLASIGVKINLAVNTVEQLSKDSWNKTFMITKIENLFEKPAETKPEVGVGSPVRAEPIEASSFIGIEDFAKVQLMVGTIEQCEEILASDKLYKLQVNFGAVGKRQILSGVRKHFKPEELIGKQAVFVVNLKPRKMMGLESQGNATSLLVMESNFSICSPINSVANGTILK